MNWTDGPATWRQLRELRDHGYTPDHHLTKSEAADLIRGFGGHPQSQAEVGQSVTESGRNGAPQFRRAVENVRPQVGESGQNKVIENQPGREEAKSRRQDFWISACCESGQRAAGSPLATELYRKHGCLFWEPTRVQVQGILDALDGALPSWEKDHPELFFQTLGMNFPQLMRKRWGT